MNGEFSNDFPPNVKQSASHQNIITWQHYQLCGNYYFSLDANKSPAGVGVHWCLDSLHVVTGAVCMGLSAGAGRRPATDHGNWLLCSLAAAGRPTNNKLSQSSALWEGGSTTCD